MTPITRSRISVWPDQELNIAFSCISIKPPNRIDRSFNTNIPTITTHSTKDNIDNPLSTSVINNITTIAIPTPPHNSHQSNIIPPTITSTSSSCPHNCFVFLLLIFCRTETSLPLPWYPTHYRSHFIPDGYAS